MANNSQIETSFKAEETGRKEHRSHPRLIVFLVCLVISVLMWLFIELMKDYTDEIKYSISFTHVPNDLILTNSGDSIISLGMNAQGFELLAAKYAQKKALLSIDLSSLKIRQSEDGYTAYLPSARIIEQLGSQINFKTNITYIKPDTLFFRFSKIFSKQVAVKTDFSYTMSPQFDITDTISCKPAYVTVSSIKTIIDTISVVHTQRLKLNKIDSSVSVRLALSKGTKANLLKYSTDSVTMQFKVEQVTEAGYTVPLSILANDKSIKIFPDKVEVLCRVPLSLYPHIEASNFSAQVEYLPSLINQKRLSVKLVKSPDKIKVLKIIPSDVEYIIISK